MSLCKITMIGNLGRDPEMRYTPDGRPVTTFSVAVNRNTKNQAGEWRPALEVTADNVINLERRTREEGEGSFQPAAAGAGVAAGPPSGDRGGEDTELDDLP